MPKTKNTQSPFPATYRLIAERDLKRAKGQLVPTVESGDTAASRAPQGDCGRQEGKMAERR